MIIQPVVFAADDAVYDEDASIQLEEKLTKLGIFEQAEEDIFSEGDSTNIKRGEAAVVLTNMLGMKGVFSEGSMQATYFDVPSYNKYVNAVSFVSERGIMSGNEVGLFLPDDEMEIGHLLKCMVVALGYQWKAEVYGGYPQGYTRVANELQLAEGIEKPFTAIASKYDFLKMVDTALDKPICKITSIEGDDVNFVIDDDSNILSEYHDIYFGKGVLQNNKMMSLSSSAEANDETVVLENYEKNTKLELYVNDVKEVYEYIGCEIEVYYKYDKLTEKNYLLDVELTDGNTVKSITKDDFIKCQNLKISYVDKNGKKSELNLAAGVDVIYNGELITRNIEACINGYQGTLKAIDNNDDKLYDVVIVKKYEYDKVRSVKETGQKIYGQNKTLTLENYENAQITNYLTGEAVGLLDLAEGNVIGFAESQDRKKIVVEVINENAAVMIKSISKDTFTTDTGFKYDTSILNDNQKYLIKPNSAISIVTIDNYYVVWAGTASETVSLGYLIDVGIEDGDFGEKIFQGARILEKSGVVKTYLAADSKKLICNGKPVKTENIKDTLHNVKVTYDISGDGYISQVIGYQLNDAGQLASVYTITGDKDSKLYLKYSYNKMGPTSKVLNDGYNTGRFRANAIPGENLYAILNTFPIFQVPETTQESWPDAYYTSLVYTNAMYKTTTNKFDSYTSDEFDIIPEAMVEFKEAVITEPDLGASGDFIFVNETYATVNSDGDVKQVVKGLKGTAAGEYYLDRKVDKAISLLDINPGDIINVGFNFVGEISSIEKVFDMKTKTVIRKKVNVNASGEQVVETVAENYASVAIGLGAMRIYSVYNIAEDGRFAEVFDMQQMPTDPSSGLPEDKKALLSFVKNARTNSGSLAIFDEYNEEYFVGTIDDVIDYRHDTTGYSRVIIKYLSDKGEVKDMVFLNFKK